MKLSKKTYEIEGIVQGVGFRPAIYCLAIKSGLGGWIKNCSGKVRLCLEGNSIVIDNFIATLNNNLPIQAKIDKISLLGKNNITSINDFKILESEINNDFKVSIPADLAMCKDCEEEILHPNNRRYRYPFTTCVNCGPRYTVVNSMPYDRCRTTLSKFPLCEKCTQEYKDPFNRRFHAESTACHTCGPTLFLKDGNNNTIRCTDPIKSVIENLQQGKIIAIKGIGGFLLAVNAFDTNSIQTLRDRKNRPDKPFAVMAKNIDIIKKYCKVDPLSEEMLTSSIAPIVILNTLDKQARKKILYSNQYIPKNMISPFNLETDIWNSENKNTFCIPLEMLSPDTNTLGVMLPYSPLHRLLFENSNLEMLIMTSGNRGGEPICIKNEEAFNRLKGIADLFLYHNRDINLRNDDSLCTIQQNNIQIWRRARGFAPESYKCNFSFNKNILAMGSELKNSIAIGFDQEIIVSPHIGDLESPEAVDGLKTVVDCFPEFLKKKPELIAIDLHPDMHSSRLGKKIAQKLGVPIIKVQHHYAHAVSCMTEHNLNNALGLVFDGTGLGTDNNIWGAELLHIDFASRNDFDRLASFSPVHLPGGDAAVYNPVRQLMSRFTNSTIEIDEQILKWYGVSETEFRIWKMQCKNKINAPLTHAAGRLFDSFAALLKVSPNKITYEGQGAIRLEAIAEKIINKNCKLIDLPFTLIEKENMLFIDWSRMFSYLYENNKDLFYKKQTDTDIALKALSFHKSIASAAVKMIEYGLSKSTTDNIVLSGGVFMNKILTNYIVSDLKQKGLKPFIHKNIPPNDGGISFGQTVVANLKFNRKER